VAPSNEQSGKAQSLTLRQPIICHAVAEREWAVDGTPADCVIVALHKLLTEKVDLVVSGINHGANLGENAYYSGTVGAAREAALHHMPAVAMSLCSKGAKVSFEAAARVARGHHVSPKVRAMVVPGSQSVKRVAEQEGLHRVFLEAGFEWRESGCSMCLGMNPDILQPGERCASTSNRNFEGRQGRGGRTHLVSPMMAAAAAIAGHFTDIRDWKFQ